MSLFTPAAQPIGIGPAGMIAAIAIPSGYRQRRLARIIVEHQSGSLNFWSACFSTDSTVTDPLAEIACWDNQLPGTRIDDDHHGVGFVWDGAETKNWSGAAKNVYARLTADSGSNAFVVGLYVDEQ